MSWVWSSHVLVPWDRPETDVLPSLCVIFSAGSRGINRRMRENDGVPQVLRRDVVKR